jgi:hypothetical protein
MFAPTVTLQILRHPNVHTTRKFDGVLTFWNTSLDLFLAADDAEVLRLICERSSQMVSDLRR